MHSGTRLSCLDDNNNIMVMRGGVLYRRAGDGDRWERSAVADSSLAVRVRSSLQETVRLWPRWQAARDHERKFIVPIDGTAPLVPLHHASGHFTGETIMLSFPEFCGIQR